MKRKECVSRIEASTCGRRLDVPLTFLRNRSLKPAFLVFFSLRGTLGAAAAAASAKVGNPDRDVGCLPTAVDITVAVADADDGSFVVDDVSSLRLIRGCLL